MDVFEYLFLKRLFGGSSNGNNDDEDFLFGLMKAGFKLFLVIICMLIVLNLVNTCDVGKDTQPKEVKQEKVQQKPVQQKKVQQAAGQSVKVPQQTAPQQTAPKQTVQQNVQQKPVQQKKVQQAAVQQKSVDAWQISAQQLEAIQKKLLQQYEKDLVALEKILAEQVSGKNSTIVADSILVAVGSDASITVGDNVSTAAPAGAQRFEVFTEKGEITLYVGMSKDSVKALMGAPYTNSAYNSQYRGLEETWEYKGRNKYVCEYTLKFLNGKLQSLRHYREP